jgi:hypothetical protein
MLQDSKLYCQHSKYLIKKIKIDKNNKSPDKVDTCLHRSNERSRRVRFRFRINEFSKKWRGRFGSIREGGKGSSSAKILSFNKVNVYKMKGVEEYVSDLVLSDSSEGVERAHWVKKSKVMITLVCRISNERSRGVHLRSRIFNGLCHIVLKSEDIKGTIGG